MEQRRSGFRSGGGGGGGFNRGPREMHTAICSGCNKECQVPFKPAEGREVFCLDCYKQRKNQ